MKSCCFFKAAATSVGVEAGGGSNLFPSAARPCLYLFFIPLPSPTSRRLTPFSAR